MDSAFIDVLRYVHTRPPTKADPSWRREARYVAFVVRPIFVLVSKQADPSLAQYERPPPIRVDLGPALAIDRAVARWRTEALNPNGNLDAVGRDLARRVWAPIAPHLAARTSDAPRGRSRSSRSTVIVSPDGALGFIPWGAMSDVAPGSYLIERYGFQTIGSGRQLARLE